MSKQWLPEDQHRFNLNIPKDLYAKLQELAVIEGRSVGWLTRRALILYLNTYKEMGQPKPPETLQLPLDLD